MIACNCQEHHHLNAAKETQMNDINHAKNLARIQRIAKMMDTAWGIPFTRWRFGLDSVLGLVPGAGDAITFGISAYSIYLAHQMGAPKGLMVRMLANSAMDFGLGSVPIAGDIFDLFFKSNVRNLKLLTDFIEKK
jgi:Domain of unknown function (DUF4112)